jgi:hypothetical protein
MMDDGYAAIHTVPSMDVKGMGSDLRGWPKMTSNRGCGDIVLSLLGDSCSLSTTITCAKAMVIWLW